MDCYVKIHLRAWFEVLQNEQYHLPTALMMS